MSGGQATRWSELSMNYAAITSSYEEPALLLKELISWVTKKTENCCMLKVLRVTWEEGAGERVGTSADNEQEETG